MKNISTANPKPRPILRVKLLWQVVTAVAFTTTVIFNLSAKANAVVAGTPQESLTLQLPNLTGLYQITFFGASFLSVKGGFQSRPRAKKLLERRG
jgi:hypothetical protein